VVHSNSNLRTGTDNLPYPQGQHAGQHGRGSDYSSLAVPSVWRNGRTAAACAGATDGRGRIDKR
jgi:cell division protein FtsZ